jgi:hypothetical protein
MTICKSTFDGHRSANWLRAISSRRRPRSGRRKYSSFEAARVETIKSFQCSTNSGAQISFQLKFSADGVARGGVVLAQLELRGGAIGRSRAVCQNARGRPRSDLLDQVRPYTKTGIVVISHA